LAHDDDDDDQYDMTARERNFSPIIFYTWRGSFGTYSCTDNSTHPHNPTPLSLNRMNRHFIWDLLIATSYIKVITALWLFAAGFFYELITIFQLQYNSARTKRK